MLNKLKFTKMVIITIKIINLIKNIYNKLVNFSFQSIFNLYFNLK